MRSNVKILGFAGFLLLFAIPLAAQDSPRVEIVTSVRHGVTPPLSSFVPSLHAHPNPASRVFPLRQPVPPEAKGGKPSGGGGGGGRTSWTDPDLVAATGSHQASIGTVFQGIVNGCGVYGGCVPADPNLSVGGADAAGNEEIVETVNVEYAVYDVNGKTVQAAAPIHTIFSGLGSSDICATTDGGDPIALWDKFDGRWIISQLAYNSSLSDDHWCLAISSGNTPADAIGSYSVYDFSFGSNFPDYPKLGIWLDGSASGAYSGVYFSSNTFANGNSFIGAQACAFPLLDVSSPPSTQFSMDCIQEPNTVYNILPADTDGTGAGPSGTGGLYLQFLSNKGSGSTLDLYQFQPDFSSGTGTFSLLDPIGVNTYYEACGGSACVPQPSTREKLDSLGDRLMYRLAYRNSATFPDTLFVNQSVQVSSNSSQTGIRWYEIQGASSPNTAPTVTQGTYSPDTSLYRWMGSIAADKYGDLGVGYSISNTSVHPSLAFTGRTSTDSPGNALEPEQTLFTGTGSQTNVNRWGDYSSVSVDPADDCTFWYTNEYLVKNGSYTNWATAIGSFRFSNSGCTK